MNKRFKIARIEMGLTQQELASLAKLNEHDITRIETGRWTPPSNIKERLSEALNKPAFELFTA